MIMTIDRRKFIKSSLAGAAVAGLGNSLSALAGETPTGTPSAFPINAELRISFQEGTAPGANLNEKFDFMDEHGVVGFEPHGRGMKGRMQKFKDALKGRNIKVSAVYAGFEGFILATDPAIRKKCRDINNPGVTYLGDFWHMTWEETCDMPGEDGEADNYVNGFRGLKMIGYDKYVSFECGC